MADAAIKSGHFTYGDYCGWPDDERWELIDGVAYPWHLGPAPTRSHQQVLRDLLVQITLALKGGSCEVYPAPFDVRLSDTDEADEHIQTVLQPDIAVICDQSKLDDKGCRGAPDWIIEILSPSTAAKDMIQKRDSYERHGVREYWLVHPLDHLLWIYRLEDGVYGRPEIFATEGKTPVLLLTGLEIDWDLVFPDIAG
jgi:Uma2 family endonuclease